jgi:superfamily I DNA and/or RNA helicase
MFVRLENSRSGGVGLLSRRKEMLRSEIDYTIKSTIDHYKGEIFRLNSENEKLREDLDALEQYGRRELMRINFKLSRPVSYAITNFCEILVYVN